MCVCVCVCVWERERERERERELQHSHCQQLCHQHCYQGDDDDRYEVSLMHRKMIMTTVLVGRCKPVCAPLAQQLNHFTILSAAYVTNCILFAGFITYATDMLHIFDVGFWQCTRSLYRTLWWCYYCHSVSVWVSAMLLGCALLWR